MKAKIVENNNDLQIARLHIESISETCAITNAKVRKPNSVWLVLSQTPQFLRKSI